jgi:hypothetical protein
VEWSPIQGAYTKAHHNPAPSTPNWNSRGEFYQLCILTKGGHLEQLVCFLTLCCVEIKQMCFHYTALVTLFDFLMLPVHASKLVATICLHEFSCLTLGIARNR